MKGVTLAWLTFLAIQTVQYERAHPAGLPPPKLYAGSAVVFSVLGLVATGAPQPAALMAWALVVAAGVTNEFKAAGRPLTLKPAAAGKAGK